MSSQVPSTLSQSNVTVHGNITSMCPPLLFMQLRISFLFSYGSFLWMAQATGIEGRVFFLRNNTAFRLCVEESMNSCHSFRLYLTLFAAIRPLMFLQSLI